MPGAVKMLPCPFCGALPEVEGGRAYIWGIICTNVACLINPYATGNTRKESVRRWNRRANAAEAVDTAHNIASMPCGYHKPRCHCEVLSGIHRKCGVKPCLVTRQA